MDPVDDVLFGHRHRLCAFNYPETTAALQRHVSGEPSVSPEDAQAAAIQAVRDALADYKADNIDNSEDDEDAMSEDDDDDDDEVLFLTAFGGQDEIDGGGDDDDHDYDDDDEDDSLVLAIPAAQKGGKSAFSRARQTVLTREAQLHKLNETSAALIERGAQCSRPGCEVVINKVTAFITASKDKTIINIASYCINCSRDAVRV